MIKQFISTEFLVFLLTSCIAAIANFSSRVIYNFWLDFSVAVILAYITGMIVAFALAKIFVFRASKQTIHRSVASFILVNLIAMFQTWIVSVALAYYVLPTLNIRLFAREIAHVIGMSIPVFTSYIGHKYWSFPTHARSEES